MNLKEALKEIERLTKVNKELEKKAEKQDRLIFKLNKRLNEILSEKEIINEKYIIERVKTFIPKTEVLKPVVINETEEVLKAIKQEKKPKVKGKNFERYDFEKHVSEVIYEKPEIDQCPECGCHLSIASEKVRYQIEAIPATLKVVKIIKQSCKCEKCNKTDNKIYYPLSTSLFPGSILSHSMAAYIAYHKYDLGIPFHHLEKHIKETLDIEVSKQNLAIYMEKTSKLFEPLYEQMKQDLLKNRAKVIHADETTLSISKRPEEDKERKKSYVYLYASSYYDNPIYIYSFHESRAIETTAKWLKDYQGVLVCDDFKGYTKLAKDNPNIQLQRCFAHVRRRFMDIVKGLPEENKQTSHAYQILEIIGKLFHNESRYQKDDLTPEQVLKRRNQDQRPLMKKLKDFLFNYDYKPNSAIMGAVNYAKNIFDDLETFLSNGYVEISNNIAERAIRPFVINRKVFMTSGSYAGARYTTILFSIIQTAKINNLQVSKYFEYVLDNIKSKDIESLLPYSKDLPKTLLNT